MSDFNVVDSSSWIKYFADGPNADFFEAAIENAERLIVPSISIYEVFKRLLAESDGEEKGLRVVAMMQRGRVVELGAELALEAAKVSRENKIPMADSIILATAREHGAALWTQDSDFEAIEGVRYIEKKS